MITAHLIHLSFGMAFKQSSIKILFQFESVDIALPENRQKELLKVIAKKNESSLKCTVFLLIDYNNNKNVPLSMHTAPNF